MDVAATEPGLCPGCEDPGPVATRCPRGVCSRRALHFVPPEYVGPAAPDPLIGRMVDSYLVVKLLGAGGFGKVYLALQLPILMRAAVKILHRGGDDAAEQRRVAAKFLAEARALATLSHPNIVRLLQFGAFDDTAYLAMEFVEGGTTLRDLVQRRAAARDPLSHAEVGVILRQLLDALEAAHARQIVHRDVKPENIMVQSLPGHPLFVRVLDFGLAKFVSEQTETSSAIGTPVYMAPEQVLRRHIGPWTDVYAVGALAFELFTGRRPHQGETVHEIFAKKLDSAVDPLAEAGDLGLPEPAAAFFRHALAFDHTARIQDVPACRAELELALRALVARDADLERARAVTFAPEPEPARASVPLPLPVVVESTPTRLEPAAEVAALAPLRTPPASTDTVDRGGASARPRRSSRTLVLAAVAVAAVALAVVLVVVLTRGGGVDGPLARRLPDGVRAYYRIDDVAHLRERLVDGAGLARPEALRRELDPWLGRGVASLAEELGVSPDLVWDVAEHTDTLELASLEGRSDALAMLRLTDPGLARRVLEQVGATKVGDDRYRLAKGEVAVALVDDAVVVGTADSVEQVMHPSGRALVDGDEFRAARDAVDEGADGFFFVRPLPMPFLPIPPMAWIGLGMRAAGGFSLEVALPEGSPLPDFLVRSSRAKPLLEAMPKTTLLAWSASFDGAGKPRPSLAKWLDVLPGPAADRVREDLGLGAVDATAEATADAARPDAVLALMARDFLLAELPVASELVLGIVRGEDGRLAPLAVFDVADPAQAEALATRLFDTGARKALPWRSISSDGMRLRYVDLGELIAASGGHIKGTAEAGFDLRLGYGIHDGLFVVGGVDAVYGFLAARAGREPRLGEAIDTRGVDAENALELTVQLGAFAHGPPSPVPPIAAAQAALARALPPSASYSLSARLAPRRVRVRTNAPLLALAAWLRLVERPASPEPEPVPEPGPLPEPEPVPVPPSDDAGTPLTEAQLAWPLETASGARTTLAELPRDKALLVTFWATYCTPCVEQLPVLTAAAADLGPGWQLVHLSSDDSWEPLRALAAREGSPLPSLEAPLVLRDSHGMGTAPDDTLRGSFGTTLMPDSVVIYRGRVIERFVNTQPWTSLALESQLMKVAARAGLPLPVPTPDDVEAARRALDGGTPQVSDTFDRTTLGAWESDGGWSVVDGELRGGGVGSSPVWLATPLPDAVRIELSVTSSSGDFDCVLADRATPGEALVLPRRYEPGRRYRWTLVRRGPSLYWLVDGELALARADARTPPGASLGCASQAPMSIDDVSVFALAP